MLHERTSKDFNSPPFSCFTRLHKQFNLVFYNLDLYLINSLEIIVLTFAHLHQLLNVIFLQQSDKAIRSIEIY